MLKICPICKSEKGFIKHRYNPKYYAEYLICENCQSELLPNGKILINVPECIEFDNIKEKIK